MFIPYLTEFGLKCLNVGQNLWAPLFFLFLFFSYLCFKQKCFCGLVTSRFVNVYTHKKRTCIQALTFKSSFTIVPWKAGNTKGLIYYRFARAKTGINVIAQANWCGSWSTNRAHQGLYLSNRQNSTHNSFNAFASMNKQYRAFLPKRAKYWEE